MNQIYLYFNEMMVMAKEVMSDANSAIVRVYIILK